MRASMAVLTAILAVGLTGCGGRPAQRTSDSAADTTTVSIPPPPEPVTAVAQSSVFDEEYIVHGACPFECCKYGDWTMLEGGALRSEPNPDADSVGSVDAGARVHTDSGVMVLHPPGVAVIAADTSSMGAGPRAGDTVEVISYTYTGQKVTRVKWQGQELEKPPTGVHMLRDPVQRWWVYITDPSTLRGGWLQVKGVRAEGVALANACGGH